MAFEWRSSTLLPLYFREHFCLIDPKNPWRIESLSLEACIYFGTAGVLLLIIVQCVYPLLLIPCFISGWSLSMLLKSPWVDIAARILRRVGTGKRDKGRAAAKS